MSDSKKAADFGKNHRGWLVLGALMCFGSLLSACNSTPKHRYDDSFVDQSAIIRDQLGNGWISVDATSSELADSLRSYFQYFGFKDGYASACYVQTDVGRIFVSAHYTRSVSAKGNIFLVHGYRGHGGHHGELTDRLNLDGWNVYLMDLPGHGLSEGRPFYIGDFSDYGQAAFQVWNMLCKADPIAQAAGNIFMGYSTGGSTIIELLQLIKQSPPADQAVYPDAAIFAAPLLFLKQQELRIQLSNLLQHQAITIPEFVLNPDLYDEGYACYEEFKNFLLFHDPYHFHVFDPMWTEAFYNWNLALNLETEIQFDLPVLLLQGTNDAVVDWQRAEALFTRLFPYCQIQLFDGYSHGILNLAPDRMANLYGTIQTFLSTIQLQSSARLDSWPAFFDDSL